MMTSEQYAQDESVSVGEDMGVAYEITVKARRFYKKGVRQKEMMMLMEMVMVRDGDDVIGRIAADMKGGFVVSDDINQEQWHVQAREIWDAYQTMRVTVVEEDK